MKETTTISFRLSRQEKTIIESIAKNRNITSGGLLRLIFSEHLMRYASTKKELQTATAYQISAKKRRVKEEWKDCSRDLYLIKNTTRQLIAVTGNSFMLSGKINQKAVNKIIDHAYKTYELMQPTSKDILKEDVENLLKLRNPEQLRAYTEQRFKVLQYDK